MNSSYPFAYKSAYDRYSKKMFSISRADNLTAWMLANTEFNILRSQPGHVFVIDKIRICGHASTTGATDQYPEFVHLRFRTDDVSATEKGQLIFQITNGGTTAAAGQTNRTYEFNGRLCVPEGYKITLTNVHPVALAGALITWFPEIHGFYMPIREAANLGIYPGIDNWFCKGVMPTTTSATELVPAVTGRSIQIEGYNFQGMTLTGAGNLSLTHYDATTDRACLRWYTSSGSQNFKADAFSARLERNLPIGNSLRYTTSANLAVGAGSRGCISVWGRYTDTPDTFNINGFFGIQGNPSATAAAGASTLTDSSKEWVTNSLAGVTGKIVAGTGAGATFTVSSNTATVLTMSQTWTANGAAAGIDSTSEYRFDVSDGKKWWVAIDAGSHTTATESAFLVLPSYLNKPARVQHLQVSGDSNAASLLAPPSVLLKSCLGSRKGSGTTVPDAGGGVRFPGTGLDGVNNSGFILMSPIMAVQAAGDIHAVVDGISVPISIGASTTFATSSILNVEVANGWTNVFASVDGVLGDEAPFSTSPEAVAIRYQTNSA